MDRGTHLLWDSLDLFLLDCAARRLTASARQFYSVKLSLFLRWCDEHEIKTLQALTAHDLRRYFVLLLRRALWCSGLHDGVMAAKSAPNAIIPSIDTGLTTAREPEWKLLQAP